MDKDQKIYQDMYNAAAAFISQRYPEGFGNAAVMRTDEGELLISTSPEYANKICYETGAICEAHKLRKRIAYSVTVESDSIDNSSYKVVKPCAKCLEALRYWGPDVKIAVQRGNKVFESAGSLVPYYKKPFKKFTVRLTCVIVSAAVIFAIILGVLMHGVSFNGYSRADFMNAFQVKQDLADYKDKMLGNGIKSEKTHIVLPFASDNMCAECYIIAEYTNRKKAENYFEINDEIIVIENNAFSNSDWERYKEPLREMGVHSADEFDDNEVFMCVLIHTQYHYLDGELEDTFDH